MDYLLLVVGFIILLLSGDFLVKGGVALAAYFRISTLVVGVTVVSFGTSAPELFVSLDAALSGSPDISIGNVIGSNISNIALVLGLTALLLPLPVRRNSIVFDWPMMMGASLLFFVFALNGKIQTVEGIIFLCLLALFMFLTIRRSRKNIAEDDDIPKSKYSIGASLLMITLASFGLYFGANMLVDSAKTIAYDFGISERIVALTIVAFGTSVPELATSVIAAFKKQTDISVGNIVGSNIFNILGVLGVTSIVKTINVSADMISFDLICMLVISFLLFLLILPINNSVLRRWKGGVLLLSYCIYISLLFV